MSIISAFNSAKGGMNAAATSLAQRASRIANTHFDKAGEEGAIADDQVGMILDKTSFKANLRTAKVADSLMSEIVRMGIPSSKR